MKKQGLKILIIDNNSQDRATFRHFLQKDKEFEYFFIETELGEVGIETCFAENPACVLVNNDLPDTDGLSVIKKLNPDPLNPIFPVILLTGEGNEKLVVQAIKSGAQNYLDKGKISPEELILTVHNAIEMVKLRGSHRQSEEHLRESEARYRSLFELAAVGIARADSATGRFQEVNDEFCRITGYSRNELLEMDFPELTHPDDHAADRENRRKLARGKENQATYTKRYVRKDRQIIWVRITATIVRNETGKVEYGVSIVEDITNRKNAQTALERYQLLSEKARDIVWISNPEGQIIEINQAAVDTYGYSRDEMLRMNISDLREKSTRKLLRQQLDKALADGIKFETIHVRKDGTTFPVEVNATSADFEGTRLIMSIVRDITERKEAEEKLRESEARLKLGVEVADFAICEIDYTTNMNHLSAEAAKLYGLGVEEMTVPREVVHATFHPEDAEELLPIIAESLNPDGTGWFAREHRIILKTGEIRWLSVRKQIFFDRISISPRPLRGILAAQDITERKQTEEQLRLYEKVVLNTKDAVMITEAEPIDLPGPRIVYVNPAFTKMSGYTAEEVIGETPRILQGPKTDRKQLEKIRTALKNWESVRVELTDYHKDGTEFDVEFDINPVADETGWFTHWVSIQRDTTERNQIQRALEISEERLKLAVTGANIGTFDWNIKTGKIEWSSETEESAAMPTEAFDNSFEGFRKLIHPLDLELMEQRIKAALKDGDYECEFRMLKGDGTIRWVIGKGRVFFDDDGTPARLVGVADRLSLLVFEN